MTFLRKFSVAALSLGVAFGAYAAGGQKHAHPPEEGWSFEGAFGEFDKDALQRGYQVYREVCSSCHSMKLMKYRNLGEKGGPFYDPEYSGNENPLVKAFAAEDEILKGVDDAGEPAYGPATPADTFKSPYANDAHARASNAGALPPDLSVITKARHGGASYVYSLMVGYPEAILTVSWSSLMKRSQIAATMETIALTMISPRITAFCLSHQASITIPILQAIQPRNGTAIHATYRPAAFSQWRRNWLRAA